MMSWTSSVSASTSATISSSASERLSMVTRFEAGDLDEEEEEEDGGGSGGTGVRGGGELAPRMAEEARARRKTREAATGSILSDVAEELELEFGTNWKFGTHTTHDS